MSSHQWLIAFSDQAVQQLQKLPPGVRMVVFDSLQRLLKADNPLAIPGVKKLREPHLRGLYRARAGDYRILIELQPGSIIHLKHTYKGMLRIVAIAHRSHAYRRD